MNCVVSFSKRTKRAKSLVILKNSPKLNHVKNYEKINGGMKNSPIIYCMCSILCACKCKYIHMYSLEFSILPVDTLSTDEKYPYRLF